MQWTRDEYLDLMTFSDVPRQMFVELFGLLIGLDEEWRTQGASEGEIGMEAFCWPTMPLASCGAETGRLGGYEPVVLEETEDYRLTRDELGRTMRLSKKAATLPLPQDWPVQDWDTWLEIKPWYAFSEERIDWAQVEIAKELRRQGYMVMASIPGGFDLPRQLMGEEFACLCYYDQPDLMHDILGTVGDSCRRVFERISEVCTIDHLHVHEDMAGKTGSLVGPKTIQEFIKPYYRATWDVLSARGTRLFSQDSDGNMNAVIPAFMESGINVMYPMEPAADMDIVAVRKQYGNRLAVKGGIDKHVLRDGNEAIRKELEYKMQPLMQAGGTVFGLDHRIPNGTPLEAYRFYVQTGREILGLPPLSEDTPGFQRMAF